MRWQRKTAPKNEPKTRSWPVPRVDVYGSDDDPGGWRIGCDELLVLWDVETGQEAEEIVRELLAEQAPQLLTELEFDSYPEAFFASARTESTARAVAAAIQGRRPS